MFIEQFVFFSASFSSALSPGDDDELLMEFFIRPIRALSYFTSFYCRRVAAGQMRSVYDGNGSIIATPILIARYFNSSDSNYEFSIFNGAVVGDGRSERKASIQLCSL
jgi:hypothetical protein